MMDNIFDLTGRTALITGSTRGIGLALVGPAVWLASDASAYVNGQVIFIDGGISVVV